MLPPGSTIGILGGGQLARMMALAAAPLGLRCHIYAPPGDNPAFQVASSVTVARYDDAAALSLFAAAVSVVTYEFENVPAETAALLAETVPVLPGHGALAVTQDRLVEKRFVRDAGLMTPDFRAVDSVVDLDHAVTALGRPSVLKTRRFGYDGKGQVKILPGTDLAAAFAAVGSVPSILEAFVPFVREVSVIAARSANGTVAVYDVCENDHRDHILSRTTVPARLSPATAHEAVTMAARLAHGLNYVGVLAVEMFVVEEAGRERLLVNEMAPRVHNSGHWTIEGAETSQFEQHIRAVAGWPLGSTVRRGVTVTMDNLIGADADRWAALAAEPGAHLHLYGKEESRSGRKMGHVTRILADARGF